MKARKHSSEAIRKIGQRINPDDRKKHADRMKLAAKIYDYMKEKGWNNKQFAKNINQKQSVITRWLSGYHNFTHDTLWDICRVLDISMQTLFEEKKEGEKNLILKTSVEVSSKILTNQKSPWENYIYNREIPLLNSFSIKAKC